MARLSVARLGLARQGNDNPLVLLHQAGDEIEPTELRTGAGGTISLFVLGNLQRVLLQLLLHHLLHEV